MRGGERLTDECSQMNGICSGLHHSTGIFRYPGVRAIHQGIPKGKAFFALWDACHATTMALHLAGDVPPDTTTVRGIFICAYAFFVTCVPSNSREMEMLSGL